MSTITFYTNPMSRGQIARWALHEAGADYNQVLLDYGTTMKEPEFLAINPMGKVPTIVHNSKVVTECAAICAYLAEVFPDMHLTPNSDERADYYRWMFFCAGPVEAAITNQMLGVAVPPDKERSAGYGNYDQTTAALAGHFANHDYVCGDRFTMADVYVGSQVLWGTQFGTLPKDVRFERYAARLSSRPAYAAAKAVDDALIAERQGM
jgi:glutathione S-transferase